MANGTLYTTKEAAAVLGVDEERVRKWLRSGIVRASTERGGEPGGRRRLSFTDLIALKAAKELVERGVSLAAVRRNLAALEGALPARDGAPGQALLRLRVVSDGTRLVVVGDDVVFEPLSGQVVMDFVVGALSRRAAEVLALPPASARAEPERSAWAWFEEGLSRDRDGRHAEAQAAFLRALALDPAFAAAHTNLGNLAHAGGRRGEARAHYEQALALDEDQPEARYNLGNLLDELGDSEAAIAAWTRVTALHPDFADAHFNLGAALAERGDPSGARACLERYLRLDAQGLWADSARELLVEIDASVPAAIGVRSASVASGL